MTDDRGSIVLGIIILVISVLVLLFVGWVYVNLTGPIANSLTLAETETQLGVDASPTVLYFGALGFIGFIIGLVIWFILRPVGNDVRQSTFRRM